MRPTLRLTPLALAALSAAGAQQVPTRQLAAPAAASSETFAFVAGVRVLSDGRVLVNDITRRRVLLFDTTLAKYTVVADSTSATASAYGPRPGGLIPYRGDSTLFVDPASMSMLVVDPAGKIARVMSVPRSQDAGALASAAFGGAGFDPAGRLVYRASPNFQFRGAPGGGPFTPPEMPDTAAIVRVDLATRAVDTVAFIKVPRPRMSVTRGDDGRVTMTSEINPLPLTDDWTVLPDGAIALVRGRDYHVDWVAPDGARTSSPKLPFDWQRLTDEDKIAFIDSVKAARARMAASGQAMAGGTPGAPQMRVTVGGPDGAPPARAQGGGGPPVVAGEPRTMVFGGPGGPGGGPGGPMAPNVTFVSPSELPDYKPPFLANSTRADGDGNLWIRTVPTKAVPGGPIYDVVNRKGELVERVQVPANRQVVGFGPGGVVYMTARDGDVTRLERARLTR